MPRWNLGENLEIQMNAKGWKNGNELNIVHHVGDIVKYNNRPYIIINEDFDCGGNLHVLGIVKLETRHPVLLHVKYVGEEEIEDYEAESIFEIRRGM